MGMRGNPPSPPVPAGAHERHVRPFGGEKVHWTFSSFRLTSREGRGEVGENLPFGLNRLGWAGILFAPFAPVFSRFSRAEERISPIRAKPPLVSSKTQTADRRIRMSGAGSPPAANENGE